MSKSILVEIVSKENDLTLREAHKCVTSVLNGIEEALKLGEEINITGFGRFGYKYYPEKQGRNPRTGEPITIKERVTPFFKPGKNLKEAVKDHLKTE